MIENDTTTLMGELEQTTASIFETMMGLELKATASLETRPRPDSRELDNVTANVHFTGSWSGVILLEVSAAQACFFAGRFLSMDTPTGLDDDVRDVLGELANMIGGNLKSAIAPDATLSIPEVVDGFDFSVRICGGTLVARQSFACESGIFSVSLIESRQGRT